MVREVIRMVTDGGSRYLRGVTLDVADETAARLAVDRLAATVDNQSDPLVVVAPRASIELEPTVLHMNPAFSRLAGITASTDQGQGQGLWTVAPWLPRTVRADLDELVTTGRASDRDDLSIATPLGTRNYDFEIVPLPDGSAAIQFNDVTDRKHAIELIRHQAFHDPLTAELHRPVNLGGIDVGVSASIGGAVAPLHGDEPHLLLQRADVAMYNAKHSGQTYRLYVPDDDRQSADRLTLMGDLKGLLDDELRVWFQPKIDLRSGRTSGLEVLARWQHPRMGLLGPGQVIELCQLSGLISELTFRALDLSLAAIADWPGQSVAVNVPVRNLYDRTIAEVLEELHDLGVGISIDDFGTGFSSLAHLRRLSVDEIKIDPSFVMGLLDNENDYMIARSIIDLAHNLGHRVVAEGVADSATLTLLGELGCDVGAGWWLRSGSPGRIDAS